MNKIKLLAIIGLAALSLASVQAQVVTNTLPTATSVFTTFGNWVGSYNTNAPAWGNLTFWDGPIYQSGVNVANELGGSFDLWKENAGTNTGNYNLFAGVEARARQGAIGGVLVSEQAGGEFGFEKYDLRAGVYLDGGYRNSASLAASDGGRLYGEAGLFADKQLSNATVAGIFIAEQSGNSSAPIIGIDLNVNLGSIAGFIQQL